MSSSRMLDRIKNEKKDRKPDAGPALDLKNDAGPTSAEYERIKKDLQQELLDSLDFEQIANTEKEELADRMRTDLTTRVEGRNLALSRDELGRVSGGDREAGGGDQPPDDPAAAARHGERRAQHDAVVHRVEDRGHVRAERLPDDVDPRRVEVVRDDHRAAVDVEVVDDRLLDGEEVRDRLAQVVARGLQARRRSLFIDRTGPAGTGYRTSLQGACADAVV